MEEKDKMKRVLFISLTALLLIGCSEAKIDTSSDESMKASIEKVRKSLPEDKRGTFDEALKVLAFSQINLKDIFAQGASGVGDTQAKVKESLNGKTGIEVIAEAERVKQERKEKEKVQALKEIKELEEKRIKSENARKELSKFQVLRSRFYKEKQEFMGEQPIIEITVKNGTAHPVSRAHFKGILTSAGRSVPWLQESFNYEISGGLEAGEEATWKLAPNMFSEWGTVKTPEHAILTVEVEQLDGADGNSLFSIKEFSQEDVKRLEKLKQEYGQ